MVLNILQFKPTFEDNFQEGIEEREIVFKGSIENTKFIVTLNFDINVDFGETDQKMLYQAEMKKFEIEGYDLIMKHDDSPEGTTYGSTFEIKCHMDDYIEYIEINKCNISFQKKPTSKKYQTSGGLKWRIYKKTRYEIGYYRIYLVIDENENHSLKFMITKIIIESQDYTRRCELKTSEGEETKLDINDNRLVDLSMLDVKKYSDYNGSHSYSIKAVFISFISE
ncbi:hypothetical protein RF11_07349 [Thelohanellus kitauei]|uniref:MATH domain-containing protein n=1 Tax=Thelohanellus kitauei TaxID=669202 RepID=A0A0C2MY54_THEKT|nr:hypothetical protein RF11_07349 [Thelohanellus kitauei]